MKLRSRSPEEDATSIMEIHPGLYAFKLAAIYALAGLLYIAGSGYLAAVASRSQKDLEWIEMLKGFGFIAVTGVLLLWFSYHTMRRLAHQAELVRRQRDALVVAERRQVAGLFASAVAHDISNILMTAEWAVSEVGRNMDIDAQGKQAIRDLTHAHTQLAAMAKRLAHSSDRLSTLAMKGADLAHVVNETIAFARMHPAIKKCQVSQEVPSRLLCACDVSIIQQALVNLLINAADATQRCGHILVRLRLDGSRVALEVEDNGPGIHPDQRTLVLEPLYTTKTNGCGLGLLSVHLCAEVHGGAVEIGDSPLGGARVTIFLAFHPVEATSASRLKGQ